GRGAAMQAALRDYAWADRRRDDASCRSGDADGARAQGRPQPQDLHRPQGRTSGGDGRPRSHLLRRTYPYSEMAGSRSGRPLRHNGLCALRAGRRQASEAESQAASQAEAESGAKRDTRRGAEAGATADPATKAVTFFAVIAGLAAAIHDASAHDPGCARA